MGIGNKEGVRGRKGGGRERNEGQGRKRGEE